MRISQHQSKVLVIAISVWVFFSVIVLLKALPLASASPRELFGALLFFSPLVAFSWAEFLLRHRYVEINPSRNEVVSHSLTWFLNKKAVAYPLSSFSSVVSYITSATRFPLNHVELVSACGQEALLLATFSPAARAKSFLSLPTDGEPPEAEVLRNSVAAMCGVKNGGVLGKHFPFRQSRPNPAMHTDLARKAARGR